MEESGDEDEWARDEVRDLSKAARSQADYAGNSRNERVRTRAYEQVHLMQGMAREERQVRRSDSHRRRAEAMGRVPAATTVPTATHDQVDAYINAATPEEERDATLTARQRDHKRHGFPRRDAEYWDAMVFTPAVISLYTNVKTVEELRAKFARPTPASLPAPVCVVQTAAASLWQWTRRPNRMRRTYALAFTRPMGTLVAEGWLHGLAQLCTAALGIDLGRQVTDLLGRWVALIHVTAPKAEEVLIPLRVLSAYLCFGGAHNGICGRDGDGTEWAIIPPLPTQAQARLASLYEPLDFVATMSVNGGSLKRRNPEASSVSRDVVARFASTQRMTRTQIKAAWDRLVKVIDMGHFTAPWFYDWFSSRQRQCWPLE
jgi:hypothetical protein